MIYLLTIAIVAMIVIAWIIVELALTVRDQDQLIDLQRKRIAHLESHVEQQQVCIAWHVAHTDEVDTRNAWREWAVGHHITALPKAGKVAAVNAARKISWN